MSIASGACAHAKSTHGQTHPQRVATQKGEEDHVHDERWNSVLGQSLEDLQHEAQLAQVRNTHLALAMRTKLARVQETPHLALATGTLLARVKKTSPQALAQEEMLARVQYSPPLALALENMLARVQYSPPLALVLEKMLARVQYSPQLALAT